MTITSPLEGDSFIEGATVSFIGTAVDAEDGDLDGGDLVWAVAGGAELGTGNAIETDTLPLGLHTIELSATDSDGGRASGTVTIRIVAPPAPDQPRAGETNPYAGRINRTPAKLDDELVVIGRADAEDQLVVGIIDRPIVAYDGPSSDPAAPRTAVTHADLAPVAAAAGRIIASNLHQAAMVTVTTPAAGASQFALDIVGLYERGRSDIARHTFVPPLPGAPIGLAVADLDAFDDLGGDKRLVPPTGRNASYNDEVVLALHEMVAGELKARVTVLSFEGIDFPENREGALPGPVSTTTAVTSRPMRPGSKLVVLHGDAFYGSLPGPHLAVAYLDTTRRIALDVFVYAHTRSDPTNPDPRTDSRSLSLVQAASLGGPLSEAAADASGWDMVIARAEQFGMDQLSTFDIVLTVSQDTGAYRQAAWKLEGLDGTAGEVQVASESGEFGRVTDVSGSDIPLTILPNSRVRAVVGRIVDPPPNRCEALGLFVLADTDRGPVVQAMSAFIEDPFIGAYRLGPLSEVPAWPHVVTIRARPQTTLPTATDLAAGGFVAARNALIDHRGKPGGAVDDFAEDCDNANTAPYLGPMPSFYVSEPETGALHAVTMLQGSTGGGITVSAPLGAAFGTAPVMLLAADADGDAAYYASLDCIGPATSDCRRIFLGDAELHYAIENIETSTVILRQPPKHVDFLRELGGIVDVSMRPEYFAEFEQTDVASGQVTRRTKTDWSIGGRLGIGLGPPAPPKGEFKSVFDMSLDLEHQTVAQNFDSSSITVSLKQSAGAVDDDVVWSKLQTIDYWRFPAQGGRPERSPDGPTGFPDDAYMEIAVPDEPVTLIGPGVLNDSYQPTHQVGNILSYPTIDGDATDLGELFNFLGSYVPTDEAGTRQCRPASATDPLGCLIRNVTGELQRVTQVLAGDDFISGEFESLTNPIDVANVLQVGGITYSAELEFDTDVKRGATVTNSDRIKAEANLEIPLKAKVAKVKVPAQIGELNVQLRAQASFENERNSENTLGSKTKIALHVPSSIPVERSYRIRPSFGFTPGGSLEVSYQVDTQGAAATFWQQHYGAPDPALNLPHRIVRTPDGLRLGTDFSRGRMKGFFVRDGTGVDPSKPGDVVGDLLTDTPHAGDPVQLEVRVYNLSVATPVNNLVVHFSAQRYEAGALQGEPVVLGETTIPYLPYRGQFADQPNGHVTSAFLLWDTTAFGPPTGSALASYVVYVTLDPHDAISNERHELEDRYDDPLLGPTGEVLDAGLEKGQNNRGWSMVRIAPSLAAGAAAQKVESVRVASFRQDESIEVSLRAAGIDTRGPLTTRRDQPVELEVLLGSPTLETGYGRLHVYDGDPRQGGRLLVSRTVQGLSGGAVVVEPFTWRPTTRGVRMLYATYTGPAGEQGDGWVVVNVRD